MIKNRELTTSSNRVQQPKKQTNNFKALYQLTKQRRSQINNNLNLNLNDHQHTRKDVARNNLPHDQIIRSYKAINSEPVDQQTVYKQRNKTRFEHEDAKISHRSQRQNDSLDDLQVQNVQEHQRPKQINIPLANNNKPKQKQKTIEISPVNKNKISKKKSSHNRSNSCPFMNLSHIQPKLQQRYQKFPPYFQKLITENESKRTLKKTSTLHRKGRRADHKYSISHCSQYSQQSNTVIVHSLPIQHLSSMLYQSHHEKQHNFKKSGLALTQTFPEHVFTIHNDIYFQTRLQQQIKMYDLSQQMKQLHKQTDNVKIKQVVLQKLANKFEKQDFGQQDSLLIH